MKEKKRSQPPNGTIVKTVKEEIKLEMIFVEMNKLL